MTKYRKGDIVTITATIQRKFDPATEDSIFLEPTGHYANIFVKPEFVRMLRPFFALGDEVVVKRSGERGQVIGTFDNSTWVRLYSGHMTTENAGKLELWTGDADVAEID